MKEAEKKTDLDTQQVENTNIKLQEDIKNLEKEVKDSNESIKQLKEEKIVVIKERNTKNKTQEIVFSTKTIMGKLTKTKKELAKCVKSKVELTKDIDGMKLKNAVNQRKSKVAEH